MAKNYECVMSTEIRVIIKADSEEQAMDWISTHDFSDIRAETTKYDITYNDRVECQTSEEGGIDISSEEGN